jgi:broad specificity phosphatase PhoE
VLALALILLAVRVAPTEIDFVRHGETVANATGRYNRRTIDTFSDKGEREVASLTRQLSPLRFDAIVVSPSPRALLTIAPYLRAHHLKAEVWPELYECCDANTKKIKGPTSPQIRFGAIIKIPSAIASLFTFAPGRDRYILAPSYEDGIRQIRMAADHLKRQFRGRTVLVVGHSLHGGRMIELLKGKPITGRTRPENARIMRFQEQADGKFAPVQ